MPKKQVQVKGYLSVSPEDRQLHWEREQVLREAFKGEVFDKEVKFPRVLGVEHPFSFEDVEKVLKRTGIVSGAVNKFVDAIVGDFTIKAKSANVEAILLDFIKNTNFATTIREWLREAISKGNGFMELDLEGMKIRVLNANEMFVKRNKKGEIKGYNQFTGKMNLFSKDSKKLNEFDPDQIAHYQFNKIAGEAYGLGIIWPNERTIENLILKEQDLQKLIFRKANSPYHVKVGVKGEFTDPKAVDDVAALMTFMNNRTNWVTDANTEISVIQLSELGKSLMEALNHDVRMLSAGMEIPEVLFGSGQLNEGIALTQAEAFQRKGKSIQEEVESIIEEKIFRPLLLANDPKFDENVEFIWNLPGEDVINKRIEKISALLSGMTQISAPMRAALEIELARLFNIEGLDKILIKPQKAKEQEEKQEGEENAEREEEEEEIPQPEVPGAKPNANQKLKMKSHADMTVKEFVNLKEFHGFTYSDYVVRILRLLTGDKFTALRAITNEDLENGLLSAGELTKLRLILKDGFRNNRTIRQIEGRISRDLTLRDRLKDGSVVVGAGFRANMIARTETVRLANRALLGLYTDNNITQYRFLAALSSRTCPKCEGLNSRVFDITEASEGVNLPPIHASCRCTTIGIVE